ncbi:MAG TPA: sigma-70 family RNA polymerase sigma factor [Gemmataceae bacterium]|nr:sigma-70 family RNA polymerase sigma factor [Gemmataceae bacterium]
MPTGPVHGVLDHVRRAALREEDAALTDGELLTRYLARRDATAFEALVRRHGPMILGVCRRILRSEADAEDAFQAVFLVLIRKAASIRPRERTANWLYGVACRTAQKARAAAVKRRLKERRAGEMHRPQTPDDRWAELLPLLDRELHRLPDRYRIPIILCELEGKTHKEAAHQLGWPVGTVSGRLSRGRAELARRLKRRGAAPQDLAPAVVPPALTASTVKAATAGAASAAAIALAEGTVRLMLAMKLKAATAVVLMVALAGAGAAVAWAATSGKEGRAPMNPHATAAPQPDKAPETPADADELAIRDYIAELRATVKNPSDDHAVYRIVIDRRFHKAVTWAARHGEDALVVELIQDYYGPGNPDRGGTALTWAAWLNDAETVQILLDRGAKVDAADAGGRTALHMAVDWGAGITKLLVDKGADVNVRTHAGETPLMFASAGNQPEGCQPEVVRMLLDKKADVNARDDAGRTPLMYAAENGRLENAKLLLSEGADVRLKDKKGKTALDLVKPADNFLKWTGAWTEKGLKAATARAEQDAEALRALLKRAGGGD